MENKRYYWFNEASEAFMRNKESYLQPHHKHVSDRVMEIGQHAEKILGQRGFAEEFEEYMSRGYYSLSTPIWTNFGTTRGLSISCFGSYIEDRMDSILFTAAEVGMMSKNGGGTSAYFGKLRPRGAEIKNNGKSSGSVHFMQLFDTISNVISQGSSRRGSFAAYLDIHHPDIEEFLKIRTEGFPIQDISFGVCVPDWWLEEMKQGDREKRKIWARVIQLRGEIGYPYIFFTDNVNRNTVDVYKDKNMVIHSSNLCSEICLPTNENESFVCDLSSINLLHWDEIKNQPRVVHILVQLLDAVMTDFIERASKIKFMERAVEFAKNHRALGIGVLGLHSYYQSKMIPFESLKAKNLNHEIFKFLKEETYAESKRLAERFGEPSVLKGYGRRNTTLLAVAPTTSSAFILGQVSQSIEPYHSNYFVKDVAKGKFTIKNPYLTKLLEEKGKNDYETWDSILKAGGSVQHLDFLTQHEKDVFKTFEEISQKEIIIQASIRQRYIDQSQSLNLMIHPDTPAKDINELILFAHEQGIKTLYYQHSINSAKEFSRKLLQCVNCE
ncbi:MAG: ribonucleoside-diphosphate reductase subunit alpha [Candidatus Dojkabacteria bacterium]|nr:ribonucleoside-diphosphate reductase subunit alpha [Candidatus Dojkabacteria bacterium]